MQISQVLRRKGHEVATVEAGESVRTALALTDKGQALREQAERIPAGIVERLGMPVEELMTLQSALTRVIAASQHALEQQQR